MNTPAPSDPTHPESSGHPGTQSIEDARILVVDDEPATVQLIRMALRQAGYRHVTGATDPRALIDDRQAILEQGLDLILLDGRMPGLDGFAVMERMAAWDWPHGMPLIVMITADHASQLRALQLGAVDFIVKPIDLPVLLLRVGHHLGNRLLQRRLARSEARSAALARESEQGHLAKDLFLANISHELRTPLTAIIGFTTAMLEDPRLAPDQVASLDSILRNIRHLHGLVSDLLDISKLEVGHLRIERADMELLPCLAAMIRLIGGEARRKGLEFRCHPLPPLPAWIETDPTRFRQILFNLLGNAVKFTETGAVYLFVSYDQEYRQLVITVQDSGPGIPNDALPSIFDPFTQLDSSSGRQYGGSGLGLAIARGLAEQLGGAIDVTSNLGQGSVFIARVATGAIADRTLREALDDWRCEHADDPDTAVPPKLAGTVLVAEDTPDVRDLIRRDLERAGIRAILTTGGGDLVTQAQRHANVDLVLLDLHMPDLDGISALELLRLTGFDTPVVALTADVSARTRDAALAAGCAAVLHKPIDPGELHAILARYLRPAPGWSAEQ